AGSYTLGVRGRNENGMKGAETQISMVIGAPPAPSSVIWTPGLFSADLVPVMRITATTDTSFEFWYSGLKQIENPADIEDQTQFLGRSNQWTLHGLQADKTYYVYVRTRNAFGVSEFVEASGQASSDIPGMIELIDEQIRESDAFKNVQEGVDTNLEGIMSNALADHGTVEHQWMQYGEVRAEILVVKTTVATAEQGLADLSTYVQASIGPEGTLTAAVNQKLTAEVNIDGTAKASHVTNLGIVRNGVKYSTGFGMSIEPSGNSYKSTVVFAADQFGIYSGSDPGNYTAAFFVYNGQVFIRDALIQDGSITNAKIGNYIRSTSFIPGPSGAGWNIDKNGNCEFHGQFYANSGQFSFNGTNNTVVINGNGVTVNLPGGGRVVVGRWS
ncbi:phage tail tip fiber protein, partial [Citrobacter freundii]|uniref:phage tail tip protein J-related protein n=1 Tax=Citrobacter freundii TaxID=546 RepID=UPI002B271328